MTSPDHQQPAAPEPQAASGNRRPKPRRGMGWLGRIAAGLLIFIFTIGVILASVRFELAYMPPLDNVANPDRINLDHAYDLWGRTITQAEAEAMMQTEDGRAMLQAAHGAIRIDDDLRALGREAFYKETFGNDRFLTDIVGIMEGPIGTWSFIKAIWTSRWSGTNNLQVRLSQTITVGGRTFEKGELFDTGLDLPRGAIVPMGFAIRYDRGKATIGITCAACHSTVDPDTGLVLEGVTNNNFNVGMMLAFAPNSAAYFSNATLPDLDELVTDSNRTIEISTGERIAVPDPQVLEEYIDAILVRWPPGFFDSTIDLVANPTKVPDAFTWMDHPFSWSGSAGVGPFRGLSALSNNVHAVNADSLSEAPHAQQLYGIDEEMFYALMLQNAANRRWRFDPLTESRRPSEFFAERNPTPGAPGVGDMVPTPNYPMGSLLSSNGVLVSLPGHTVWQHINAIAAFQNTLTPPTPPVQFNPEMIAHGRQVFEQAGCIDCHSGPALTNHTVVPSTEVGTNPARALGLRPTEGLLEYPVLAWAWDTPVREGPNPIPEDATVLEVPIDHLREEDIRLSFGHDDSPGGYKVKGLVGIYWQPPYLHDGGVAVGPDAHADLGLPGTLFAGIQPDPANSLRALIDRQLRQRVISANREAALHELNVEGIGHERWVDQEAGFSREDQDALIHYLISLDRLQD
jgi:hypothetical protein